MLKRELRKLGKFDEQHCKLLFSEHHLSHAASAFFGSDFQEAAIITVDGVENGIHYLSLMGKPTNSINKRNAIS